jgi:hypothetical protein
MGKDQAAELVTTWHKVKGPHEILAGDGVQNEASVGDTTVSYGAS